MVYKKIISSGTQLELFEYDKIPNKTEIRKSKDTNLSVYKKKIRRHINGKRASKQLYRILLTNFEDAKEKGEVVCFATFTFPFYVEYGDAWNIWNTFTKRYKRIVKKNLKYIVVPEFHQSGNLHFHAILINIEKYLYDDLQAAIKRTYAIPEEDFQETNSRVLQSIWATGFVDCISTDASPAIARYLTNYLEESMQDPRLMGKRSFNISHGLKRPTVTSIQIAIDFLFTESDYKLQYENKFETSWLGTCKYSRYTTKPNIIEKIK